MLRTTVKGSPKKQSPERQNPQTPPKPIPQDDHVKSDPLVKRESDEDVDDFDDRYGVKTLNWEGRISDTTVWEEDPNKTLKNYDKAIKMAQELKAFCESNRGGTRYDEENFSDLIPGLLKEKQDYLDNVYKDEKENYESIKAAETLRKKAQKKILKALSEGVILQTELKDRLTGEELTIYESAVNNLIKDGKINKRHQGKRVIYTLAETVKQQVTPE